MAGGRSPQDERVISGVTATGLLLRDVPPEPAEAPAGPDDSIIMHASKLTAIDVELQMRPALSLGCLCFILVGCPVGIWFSRSDYLSSFITCFLPIVIVYYPLCCAAPAWRGTASWPLMPLVWGADLRSSARSAPFCSGGC